MNRWKALLETSPAILALPASGRAALAVYEGLLKLLNFKTGRLEVSLEVLTRYSRNYCRSTVAEGIRFLSEHNIISVVRRCVKRVIAGGRFVLQQVTNAYALLPPSQWKISTTSSPDPGYHGLSGAGADRDGYISDARP